MHSSADQSSPGPNEPKNSQGRIGTETYPNGHTTTFTDRISILNGQGSDLSELNTGLSPEIQEYLSFEQFITRAKHAPHLYLRNAAQYLADAIAGYGFTEINCYGRKLPHFHSLHAEWLPETQVQRKIPLDIDETMYIVHSKLSEFGRHARAEKGFLFRGPPGCGKDTIIQRLFQTLEDYSLNHPEGMRYRLAFRFGDENVAHKILGFSGSKAGDLAAMGNAQSDGFVISSPSNCNPALILSNRSGNVYARSGERQMSARENFVMECRESGVYFNSDYVLANDMDPMSAEIFRALVNYYKDPKVVFEKHVVAEKWHCNTRLAQGIYLQFPFKDPSSFVKPLLTEHPLKGQFIPDELFSAAAKIPDITSPLLAADWICFEDMLADNMYDRSESDLSRLGYLLSFIERGDVQLAGKGEGLIVNKDAVFFASANDRHFLAKQDGKTWDPFRKRFFVLAVPGIRQFRQEAEAHRESYELSVGPDIKTCPHVLETLCLFITATRLMTPQKENYEDQSDVTDDNLGKIAEKLKGGTRKALLFQSEEYTNRNSDLNMNPDWAPLSSDEMNTLRQHEWVIAHEYLRDIEKSRFGLYDGGFGISTRDAKLFVESLCEKVRDKKFATVLDVIEVLKEAKDAGFEYYTDFHESKINVVLRLYKQLCIENKVDAIDPAGFASNPASTNAQQRKLYSQALSEADNRFPLSPPATLLADTIAYAKYRVQEDFKSVMFPESRNEQDSVMKYIFHITCLHTGGLSKIPDIYKSQEAGKENKDSRIPKDVDLTFVQSFEDMILGGKDKGQNRPQFREQLIAKVTDWHSKNPPGTTLLENKDRLLELDNIKVILKQIKDDRKAKDHKEIYEFWKTSLRYNESADNLKNDLSQPGTRADAEKWQAIRKGFKDLHYHEDSILKHFRFAFDEIIKAEGKLSK